MLRFRRLPASQFFVPESQIAQPEKARVFLFFTTDPGGEAFTLADAWELSTSRYVFLPIVESAAFPILAGRIQQQIQAANSPRLAWFRANGDRIATLRVGPRPAGGSMVSALASIDLRDTHVEISAGCPIGISGESDLEITAAGAARLLIRAGIDQRGLDVIRSPLRLSLDGAGRGSFSTRVDLALRDQQDLKIGLRFFEKDEEPGNIARGPATIFGSTLDNRLSFHAVLDPLDGDSPTEDRTYLEFSDPEVVIKLPTESGRLARLQPMANARFVLANDPHFFSGGGGDDERYYLTPQGDFTFIGNPSVAGEEAPVEALLLGASATEVIEVRPGDILSFKPGQPAFFERDLGAGVSAAVAAEPESLLSSIATTSWMTVRPAPSVAAGEGPKPAYSAQPDEAPLYSPDGGSESGLDHRRLGLQSVASDVFFPILPPAGIENNPRMISTLVAREAEFVSPVRRKTLTSAAAAMAAEPGVASEALRAATPQGLVGDFDSGRWKKLVLAETAKQGENQTFSLEDDDKHHTSEALQRSRLFLVCSDRSKFGAFQGKVTIADWQFDLLTGTTGTAAPGTRQVLIFKFQDRPLEQLIEDPRLWADPDHFNPGGFAPIQQFLRDFIRKTREDHAAAGAKSPYGKFLDAVTRPEWTGVLALNGQIALEEMPEAVQGLVAGIKKRSLFLAHHIGIEMSQVQSREIQSGKIKISNSSLFGVIDYSDPEPLGPTTEPYRFHVPSLRVVFDNSEIKGFDCTLLLTVQKLFEETAELSEAAPVENTLEFKGRYESHGGKEVYTFVHEQSHTFKLDGKILEEVTSDKLQFSTVSSRKVGPEGQNRDVVARFAFWGKLKFGNLLSDIGFDLLSFDALGFSDLGLMMRFNIEDGNARNVSFDFDPGDLRLDVSINEKRGKSLLDSFALKLKSFMTSTKGFKVPDLGTFSIKLPSMNLPEAKCFRYGLAFELDLGTLGGLASGSAGLKVDLLVGWGRCPGQTHDQNRFYVGLKLPSSSGGRKEIGIQGVLRLIIEDFRFLKVERGTRTIYALKLEDCALEILGKRLPSEGDKVNLFVFADPSNGINRALSTLGWWGSLEPEASEGSFKLEYLGIGQRVGPSSTAEFKTYNDAEKFLREKLPTDFNEELVKQFYHPELGWALATRLSLEEAFTLGLVFFDPVLYSLFLGIIPNDDGTHFFTLEVQYRKVTDDIGVWSVDVGLPESVRQMEFGAVSITIPNLGLSVFTNGDFIIDVGFPRGLDFTRSCQAQAAYFIGWGGFYFGKLSTATTTMLPGTVAKTVIQAGLALRLGLGREFRKGILRAGLSVTFFGILEGAAGYENFTVESLAKPIDYALEGRFGVIGEIFGYVDFGIVKAGILVRIDIGIGVRLRLNQPTVLWIDAGVAVRVSVVIGRIRIFGKKIEIKIHFSFSARVRFDWTIGGGAAAALAAEPLRWSQLLTAAEDRAPGIAALEDLPLFLVPEVTVVEGVPQCVALLAVESTAPNASGTPGAPKPFDRLVSVLAEGALRLHLGLTGDPVVTRDALKKLDESLNATPTLADTSQGDEALDYAKLTALLASRFRVVLQAPGEDLQLAGATFFPMPADVTLATQGRPGGDVTVDFRTATPCDDAYQKEIDRFFRELAVNLDKNEAGVSAAAAGVAPSMATLVFQDYCAFLIKGGVDRLQQHLDDEEIEEIALSELLASVPLFPDLAGMASRYFRHGLRLPVAVGQPGTDAFFRLLGQQLPFAVGTAAPGAFTLRLDKHADAAWIELAGNVPVEIPLEEAAVQALRGLAVPPPESAALRRIAPVEERPALHSFSVRGPWRAQGGETTLWSLPEKLREELRILRRQGGTTLAIRLKTANADRLFDPQTVGTDVPAGTARFVTRLDLQVRRAATGSTAPVYVLGFLGEAERLLLDALVALDGLSAGTSLSLAFRMDQESPLQDLAVDPGRIFLVRTNLSTETNPGETAVTAEAASRVQASLAEAASFGRLVWQSSLVNSGGYVLFTGEALPEALFEGDTARVSLLFRFPAGEVLRPCHNALALDHPVPAAEVLFGETPDRPELRRVLEPGCVGFELDRPRPAKPLRMPAGLPNAGSAASFDELATALRGNGLQPGTPAWDLRLREAGVFEAEIRDLYHLLDFTVASDAVFKPGTETLPAGPAGTADLWRYRQAVPVHQLAQSPGNLYATVGASASLRFAWRDVFGNRATGHSTGSFIHGYFDRLIPVSEWPGVVASWDSDGTNGLRVRLAFDPALVTGGEALQIIHSALEQLADPKVAVGLRTSLDGRLQAQTGVAGFLGRVRAFLTGQAAAVAPLEVRLPVDRTAAPAGYREIGVELVVQRSPALLDPTVRQGLAGPRAELYREVREVSSRFVPAYTLDTTGEAGTRLAAFAARFETAFPGLRLATGLGADDRPALWAVEDALLAVTPSGDPAVTFAPRPLALDLWAGTVDEVRDYTEDRDESPGLVFVEKTVNAVDVDVDRTARSFLESVEDLLAPEPAAAARRVEPVALESLMASKETLAEALPGFVESVLDGEPLAGLTAAQERYRQRLRLSLRQAYDLDALVHVPLGALPASPEPARLYGKVTGLSVVPGAGGFQLSTAKVDLTPPAGSARGLAFTVDSFEETKQSRLNLDLTYEITHLERDVREQSHGEDGFETSQWLKLVKPLSRPLGRRAIPIALREYPQPPVLLGHRFAGEAVNPQQPGALGQARAWSYLFDSQRPAASQDRLVATVKYNLKSAEASLAAAGESVPQALVRFQREAPPLRSILAGLPEVLRTLDPAADPATPQGRRVRRLREALQRFADLAARVAAAFQNGELASLAEGQEDVFVIQADGFRPTADGRQILFTDGGGTVEVKGLDVLRFENAEAGVHLERNAGLVPGRDTAAGFVFRTSRVSFGQALTPFLDRGELFAVDRLTGATGTRRLEEHLHALFAALFGTAPEDNLVRIECRYRFDVRGTFGAAGALAADVPIHLFPDALANDAGLAQKVAGALLAWARRVDPNPQGSFLLDLTLFTRLAERPLPLLRLRQLVLPLASIADLP